MNNKVQDALNKQINEELFSWYVYTAMSNHFSGIALNGFAGWMKEQAAEELDHANRLMNYVHDRGGKVELAEIKAPPSTWETPLAAMKQAYEHECHISKCINDLATLANQEGDVATSTFLNWFINEQIEEEALVDDVVQRLAYVQDSPSGLFMMDRDIQASRPKEEAE